MPRPERAKRYPPDRPLLELLEVIGGEITPVAIKDAWEAGQLTPSETRWLQGISRRPLAAQERAIKRATPISDEKLRAVRAKAEKLHAQIERLLRERSRGVGDQ